MSRRDDRVSLAQMLGHAREAGDFVRGRVRADLDNDRMLTLALERLVAIIGEAANRVLDETRANHPEIPWPQIIGLRNRLTHGYDKVDLDILWTILQDDLPHLIRQLTDILSKTGEA